MRDFYTLYYFRAKDVISSILPRFFDLYKHPNIASIIQDLSCIEHRDIYLGHNDIDRAFLSKDGLRLSFKGTKLEVENLEDAIEDIKRNIDPAADHVAERAAERSTYADVVRKSHTTCTQQVATRDTRISSITPERKRRPSSVIVQQSPTKVPLRESISSSSKAERSRRPSLAKVQSSRRVSHKVTATMYSTTIVYSVTDKPRLVSEQI